MELDRVMERDQRRRLGAPASAAERRAGEAGASRHLRLVARCARILQVGRRAAAHRGGVGEGRSAGARWPHLAVGQPGAEQRAVQLQHDRGGHDAGGRYPDGVSPYGLLDMAGNVWEWTSSLWGKDANKPEFGYPYDAKDGRENLNAPDTVLRVLRGGSFRNDAQHVRCACRYRHHPNIRKRLLRFSGGVPRLLTAPDR